MAEFRSGLGHGVPMLKTSSICFVLLIASGWPSSGVYGAPAGRADLSVREAAGIRRNAYPVSGRVPFAKGELKDPSAVRLLLNDREIATQVTVESRWPDSSIKLLDVDFVLDVEMPNSKSWVKYAATIDDPAMRIRGIAFNSPVAFGAFPWLWDFGTGSWTYGSFRNASDSVTLTQAVRPGAERWKIENGPKGQEQLYETTAGRRPKIAEGWGHFQDGKEMIGVAFDKFGEQPGTYTVTFDAHGQETFQLIPAQPRTRHELAVYQHYGGSPTPIGAVPRPASMLNSLVVR